MTAASAAGHSFPPFYIGANSVSIPQDAEVSVFQALPPRSSAKSSSTYHGTQYAVAASVGKFPFRPHDTPHHAQHRSAATTTPPEPLTESLTPPTTYIPNDTHTRLRSDLKAIRQQVRKNMAEMDRWIAEMSATPQTTTMTPPPKTTLKQPSPLPNQTDSPLTTPSPSVKSAESDQVASSNLKKSDRPMSPTTTTTTTTYPSQPPHQLASLPTPPTTSSSLPAAAATREPVDFAAMQRQILRNMQEADRIYPLLIDAIKQRFTALTVEPQNPSPTPSDSLSAPAHSNLSPAPPVNSTAHLKQPTLSMTERMLLNNKQGNDTLWIPDALRWRHTLLWNREPYQLPTHPSNCTPGIATPPDLVPTVMQQSPTAMDNHHATFTAAAPTLPPAPGALAFQTYPWAPDGSPCKPLPHTATHSRTSILTHSKHRIHRRPPPLSWAYTNDTFQFLAQNYHPP